MIIGVTGGIGSGKSVVARMLAAELECPLICVDALCRELMAEGGLGTQLLKDRWGDVFFCPDGFLDRPKLREALFGDSGMRAELDALLHPLAMERMRQELAGNIGKTIVVEVPLLFEAGWHKEFQCIVVVYAENRVCLQRVMQRDRVSEENALLAINAQMELAQKVLRADHVIDNSGLFVVAALQVNHLADILRYAESGGGVKKTLTDTPEDNKQQVTYNQS